MKRTMHVVLTMPVEVLDPDLSREDVTHLIPQWIEMALKTPRNSALGVHLGLGRPSVCTVYAVREDKHATE